MYTVDKSRWAPGPWINEPDHEVFEVDGFPCIIHRVETHGSLCGYVAVPPGHPWHGRYPSYDQGDVFDGVRVHGGISYTEPCMGDICHVAKPGEPDDVWWVGFDTAHYMDISPAGCLHLYNDAGTYKTIDYVRAEIRSLVEQAKVAGK